jgi:hypothetical protein
MVSTDPIRASAQQLFMQLQLQVTPLYRISTDAFGGGRVDELRWYKKAQNMSEKAMEHVSKVVSERWFQDGFT